MALTPASLRLDLKCGNGAISEGETCHVGQATKVKQYQRSGQLSPKSLKQAQSGTQDKRRLRTSSLIKIGLAGALVGSSIHMNRNIRNAYEAKFSPAQRFRNYGGEIGDVKKVLNEIQSDQSRIAGPSLFGDVVFGKLNGKDIVVKRLGTKGMSGAAQITAMEEQGVVSGKTANALRKAQGSLQENEVQAAELAGKHGFGPKLIAAGNNTLITDIAKGRPLQSQDALLRYGQGRAQRDLQEDPQGFVKKVAALQWRIATRGNELSATNKTRVLENMARMHSLGISHNDLHPGNIFISAKGAQFIDYGTSERGGGSVAAEFVRMMNKPRAGLQQNGGMGYNLRSVDPEGYLVAEKSLRQAIGKKFGQLTAADIHKAVETSKDRDALEKRLQSITDEYYRGYANRRPDWETWRANAPKAGSTEEERSAFRSFFERNTPGLKRDDSGTYSYLTPALIRSDSKGRPCGQGHIAANKNCQKRGSFPTGKAIAAGLTAGGIAAYALTRGSSAKSAPESGASPEPAGPPSIPGVTPRALVSSAPARQSKTQRMRANTAAAVRKAEGAMAQTAREEVRRVGQIGNTMAAAGEATGMAAKTTMRELRLRTEAARRRYEPGYRRPRRDNYIQHYAPTQLQPPTRRDASCEGYVQAGMKRKGRREVPNCVPASSGLTKPRTQKDTEDGKKYVKTVTNPDTGRKNKVRYGAKGYRIAPGTDKGDNYCARSFGDMKSHGKDCSGPDRNTPLCLSRAKWKCSGKTSRRDGLTPGKSSAW